MQASLVRSVVTGQQDTPFAVIEDEVFGLHPVLDIESSALRRQPGQESLAFSCRIEQSAAEASLSHTASAFSSYICFGRVALAYPAGFGSTIKAFAQGKDWQSEYFCTLSSQLPYFVLT